MPRVFFEKDPDLYLDLSVEQQNKIQQIKDRPGRWPTPRKLKCLTERSDHAIIQAAQSLPMDDIAIAMLLQEIRGTNGRAQQNEDMGENGAKKASAI